MKRAGKRKENEGKDNACNNMKNKITCPLGFSLFFNLHKADIKNALDKQEQIGRAPCYDKRLFDKFFIELSCFYQYLLRIQLQPLCIVLYPFLIFFFTTTHFSYFHFFSNVLMFYFVINYFVFYNLHCIRLHISYTLYVLIQTTQPAVKGFIVLFY